MKITRNTLTFLITLSTSTFSGYSLAGSDIKTNAIACKSCAESPKFDQACPVITAPCFRSKISEIDKILNDLFSSKKPIVLYVHGRGNEPKKTLKEGIIETLEKDYGVKVLMFNWDSKALGFHRPVEEAQEGAPRLQSIIESLAKYRKNHPETNTIPVSLLAHSMGNITFRKAMEGFSLTTNDGPIFTNILMTGSDEDAEGHNVWMEKLTSSGINLITINEQDSTLSHSHHPEHKTPLGKNLKPPFANNFFYLNTTGLVGKVHRLFTKGKQHGRIGICNIMTAMLKGERPNLTVGQNIKEIRNGRVLIPLEQQNKNDQCFLGIQDQPDEEDDNN